jgi:hypothetical protein
MGSDQGRMLRIANCPIIMIPGTLVDLVGAYFRHGLGHTRIYGLFEDSRGDRWLYFVRLHGQSPETAEYVRGRCRRLLCEPHIADGWELDEKAGKNPSLVKIDDISSVSNHLFAWPHLPHARRHIVETESHVLDAVAEELAADSQGA